MNQTSLAQPNTLDVVVGTQYGSEGKGHVTDQVIRQYIRNQTEGVGSTVISVRVGGPNAGHCVRDPETNHKYAFRSMPVGAIWNAVSLIAPGSEVDLEVLHREVTELIANGHRPHLVIDSHATVLEQKHIDQEKASELGAKVGSTAKGIGAARADRIWRRAKTVGQVWNDEPGNTLHLIYAELLSVGGILLVTDTVELLDGWLDFGGFHVVIEGTQGYGLGLHTDLYPQCTSNDAKAIDFLSQAGINPWDDRWGTFQVTGATRTNPIRVAGNSGPLKGETTWEDLGQDSEKTTVTQKTRRVGEWDGELVHNAVRAGGVHRLALTMVDKVIPGLAGLEGTWNYPTPVGKLDPAKWTPQRELADLVARVELETGCQVWLVTTSETTAVELNRS